MRVDEERCNSKCPHETPWSRQAKALSHISRWLKVKTRCTLPQGHRGNHLGPDDSEWKNNSNDDMKGTEDE